MLQVIGKMVIENARSSPLEMTASSTSQPRTLSEVAALAGVSISTVSKVINQRSDVAAATRARVERVMAEHGYVINRAGRSLRNRRSGHIDFVVQSLLNSDYAAEILRGVEEALASTDMRVVLATTHDHHQRDRQWIQRLADSSTDGAIVVLADKQSMHLQELRRRSIPFVVVDRMGELGPEDLSVTATNWAGGRAATQYLLSLGHRRIAALLGPPAFCTQDRFAGYRLALEEAGAPFDSTLIRYGDWKAESGYREMGQLLALPVPPTAVFVGNDEQCLGVYRALYERGMRIPDEMSVVGFDDMPYAALVTPALTTVRQPLLEMGRVATKMLLRLIADEPVDTVRVEIATPLVKRSSCGPPREPL